MTLTLSVTRWLITLVGVQFLCGIVWVLGPLLPAMEPWPVRAVAVMAMLLAWAAGNLLLDWRRARNEAVLAQGLTGAARDEAAAVQARLASALALLRKTKGRRFRLDEQPWYAIIGPPGAGKTTALLNAGLTFPLEGALGPGAVSGVGGTRLCEWWFTDAAVLIDTAGRYTTQDSDETVDRAGWLAFLALLKRTRPKAPLNGVLVAIPLDEVLRGDPQAHAAAIRRRLDELESTLGVRLPVYALLTKADLLAGFTEFFDDLDRAEREQVWGVTFAPDAPGQTAGALAPLLTRLDSRLFGRLDTEPNADKRAAIAGFPAQFASILGPVEAFLGRAFGAGDGTAPPLLRGVYLTSGTQEGTPIDRLTGALSRAFGLDQRRMAQLRPEAGRAYFLADLLRRVVFAEAALVTVRPGAARRRRLLYATGCAVCAALTAGGAAFVLQARAGSLAAIEAAAEARATHAAAAAQLRLDPVADADVVPLLPWLDGLRMAALAPASTATDPLRLMQGAKLSAGNADAYRHALAFALFPRLVWRVEEQMRGLGGQPEPLYEATRLYLMLGGSGPLDAGLVQGWFERDWAQTLGGEGLAAARGALSRHLASLLQESLPAIPLDGPLVEQARATIGKVPLAARAYARLRARAAAAELPAWRPSEVLGPAGVLLFVRLSGRGLEEGVPGFYTVQGLQQAVLPALGRAAEEAAGESWVLGAAIAEGTGRAELEQALLGLYASEYTAAWEGLLRDIELAPLRSLMQAAQDIYILASKELPLRALVAGIAKQTSPAAALPAGSPARERMRVVDDTFRGIGALLGSGGAAPIDLVMRPLSDLGQQLSKQAATTSKPPTPSPGEDPALALRAEAARQPQPLARWLVAMASSGAALRDGGPRGAMIVAWNAAGGAASLCPAVIGNRYPFAPSATAEASLEDFTRLLGPGGAIDAFFNAQLKPYVDMTARPWKLQPVDGVNAPVTAADVAQFQRAASIRDLFFAGGSAQPLLRFDVIPGPLDAQATGARLELGTTVVTAAREGPARPAAVTWPGRPPAGFARLTVAGPTPLVLEATGPWALFQLLARGRFSTTGDRTSVQFSGNDRQARFDFRATPNPFATPLLTEFRCPTVQ